MNDLRTNEIIYGEFFSIKQDSFFGKYHGKTPVFPKIIIIISQNKLSC